jgi:hypothetical protein
MSGQLKLKAASLGGDIALVPTDTAVSIVVTIPAVTSTLLNDQSNIEAQTKTALNATGSAPLYGCRAWVNFNGTGTVSINASGNVSSITDNGTGDYTVNFTTAMPDANYSTNATAGFTSGANSSMNFLSTQTTSQTRVFNRNQFGNSADDATEVSVAIFR